MTNQNRRRPGSNAFRIPIDFRTTDELRYCAKTDELTLLGSLQAYVEAVGTTSWGDSITKSHLQLALDVDGLKRLNDEHGDGAGNALLVTVGNTIAKHTSRGYRRSGDEFFVLGATGTEADLLELELIANNVIYDLSKTPVVHDGVEVKSSIAVTCAIGTNQKEAMALLKRLKVEKTEAGLREKRAA